MIPVPSTPADDSGTGAVRPAEQWGLVQLDLEGPSDGNPFTEVDLVARFTAPSGRSIETGGFYDGDGWYRIRLMPEEVGKYSFVTRSNSPRLHGQTGTFVVTEPTPGSHGPVDVAETFHFRHRDGTRFTPVGTTLYAWTHQSTEMEELTLETLADGPFTKVRMCVFPKHYDYNREEPERFPYARRDDGTFDLDRFDPEYFRHLERRILDLQAIDVEADVILFHPYDKWGFAAMSSAQDDTYLRYVVRRLAAIRNIWWSLANEYDLMEGKSDADWERFAAIVLEEDHANHLRSIHNCWRLYDHSKPWITHCSIQRVDVYRTAENTDDWRNEWRKPVVVDECGYEGDIDHGWGNISGQELVRRAWEATIRGGYISHGETYLNDREVLWWSKGGRLVGSSPARFEFLRAFLADCPQGILEPLPSEWDARRAGDDDVQVIYLGFSRPTFRRVRVEPGTTWEVDVVDTWEMTVQALPGRFEADFTVALPGREYMALRLRRVRSVE